MLIEGWSAWDAFYMTVITITTVGFKEVHPLSRAGEVVHGRRASSRGVGTALYTFTLLATVVVEGGLHDALRAPAAQHMLDELKDHFIVCGYGRIGAIIVEEFRRQHVPYVVIERDPELVQAVLETGRARGRGRRQQRRRAEARRHRSGARASSPRSAPTPRTSTRCSRPACCGPTCSSSAAPRPRMPSAS